jgi:general secretion pathway protein A
MAEVRAVAEPKPATDAAVSITSLKADLEGLSEIDSAMQGFNELARLWNLKPVVEYRGVTVKRGLPLVSIRRGVRMLSLSGARPADIIKANAPCLLELRIPGVSGTRYVALTRIDAGRFVLVVPQSGRSVRIDQDELNAAWTGQAYILWRNSYNLPDAMKPGTTAPGIRRIQTMLSQGGVYKGTPSGSFDATTRQAIRQFQSEQQIPVDGMPGPRTLLHLYRATEETTGPNLVHKGDTA